MSLGLWPCGGAGNPHPLGGDSSMEYIKFSTFRKDYLDKYLAQIFGLHIFRKLKHVVTELDKNVSKLRH